MSVIPLCVKTPKGLEEVERRAHGLPMRARQILIMIDGKRDHAMLSSMFPGDALDGILQSLLNDGFITPLSGVPKPTDTPAGAAPAPAPAASKAPAPADDYERYQMARNFMINTTSAFLGISGSSLIGRLEESSGLDDLRQRYTEWRDALALSKDGKARLGELEQRLAALLS